MLLAIQPKITAMEKGFYNIKGEAEMNCWKLHHGNKDKYLQCMLDSDERFEDYQKKFKLGMHFYRKKSK